MKKVNFKLPKSVKRMMILAGSKEKSKVFFDVMADAITTSEYQKTRVGKEKEKDAE